LNEVKIQNVPHRVKTEPKGHLGALDEL